jgi:hypothetical protein
MRMVRSSWRVLAPAIFCMRATAALGAQNVGTGKECAAASCEDQAIVISAIDAVLDTVAFCSMQPTRVLATLHPEPYTAFSDGVRGRISRYGLPSSPATLRLEDLAILSPRKFSHAVVIVDSQSVRRAAKDVRTCLVVASPPMFRDREEVRVIVAVSETQREISVQYFVFLRRNGTRWIVARREIGFQS